MIVDRRKGDRNNVVVLAGASGDLRVERRRCEYVPGSDYLFSMNLILSASYYVFTITDITVCAIIETADSCLPLADSGTPCVQDANSRS
jgi:hypothetical protein